jgi:ferredoxin-NADP reductase/DMSO/TMAO reductase YedYZ heme-binding membrane subunit
VVNPLLWWFLARAGGLVAWGLLTLTIVWGVLLRTRLVPKAPPAMLLELHRFLGGLAAIFVVLHVVGLLADKYVPFGVADVLVPFAATWRPTAVAYGVLALYLFGAVLLTSALLHRMPRRWWRRVHLLNYPLFWVASQHALLAGTDARSGAMTLALYVAVAVVLLLTLLRVLSRRAVEDPVPSGFQRLTVAEIRTETPDAVSVAFKVPARLATAFRFTPGQYLTLRVRLDGVEVRRAYSICSGVGDPMLRIAVKRVADGRMSTWVHTALRPRQKLDVLPPAGSFTTDLWPGRGRELLGVAAGSGITPILSIIASVLVAEPHSRCTLLYGNRSAEDTMFAGRLRRLERHYRPRLRVFHVLSRELDRAALHGRITADAIRELAGPLLLARVDEAFVCGPGDMTTEIRDELIWHGVPAEHVHVERFRAPATNQLTVVHAGTSTTVPAEPGETILDSGLRAGLDLPYSCRSGVCGTCRARVGDGPDDPTASGPRTVLACQSRLAPGTTVADFDAV